jgi:hypothetical protein
MRTPVRSLKRANKLLLAMSLAATYLKIVLEFSYKTPDFAQPADYASVQQKYPVLVSRCPVVGALWVSLTASLSLGAGCRLLGDLPKVR